MSRASPTLGFALAAFFGGVALCAVLGSWLGNPFDSNSSDGLNSGGPMGSRTPLGTDEFTEGRLVAVLAQLVEGLERVESALDDLEVRSGSALDGEGHSDRRIQPLPGEEGRLDPSEGDALLLAIQELTSGVRALQTRGISGAMAGTDRRDPGVFGRDALLDSVQRADEQDLKREYRKDYFFWTPAQVVDRFGQPDHIYATDGVFRILYELEDPKSGEFQDVTFRFFDGFCISVQF